jgi:hypothetical protein
MPKLERGAPTRVPKHRNNYLAQRAATEMATRQVEEQQNRLFRQRCRLTIGLEILCHGEYFFPLGTARRKGDR